MKRWSDEPGSDRLEWPGGDVVSALARIEVASAIWRRHREGRLGTPEAAILAGAADAELRDPAPPDGPFLVVGVGAEVITEAALLIRRHRLRTLDALQLATAVVVRSVEAGVDTFVTFDRALRDAAAAELFAVFPPSSAEPLR